MMFWIRRMKTLRRSRSKERRVTTTSKWSRLIRSRLRGKARLMTWGTISETSS